MRQVTIAHPGDPIYSRSLSPHSVASLRSVRVHWKSTLEEKSFSFSLFLACTGTQKQWQSGQWHSISLFYCKKPTFLQIPQIPQIRPPFSHIQPYLGRYLVHRLTLVASTVKDPLCKLVLNSLALSFKTKTPSGFTLTVFSSAEEENFRLCSWPVDPVDGRWLLVRCFPCVSSVRQTFARTIRRSFVVF